MVFPAASRRRRAAFLVLLAGAAAAAAGWAVPGRAAGTSPGARGTGAGRSALEQLTRAEPGNADAWFRLGRLDMDEGRFADAVGRFEKAVALRPEDSRVEQWYGRASGMLARGSGNPLRQLQLVGQIRAALEKAVALDPGNLAARDDLAMFYVSAPGPLGGSGAKARQEVAEIRRRDPYAGELTAGEVAQRQRDPASAERAYERAVGLAPQRPESYHHLAEICAWQGRYDQAFSWCEKLRQVAPEDPEADYYLGMTGARAGQRLPEAEAALRRYLTVPHDFDAPTPALAHLWLGTIAEKRRDPAAARREYAAAHGLDPADDEIAAAWKRAGR